MIPHKRRAVLADSNSGLIRFYYTLRGDCETLVNQIQALQDSDYHEVRDAYNETKSPAFFYYLNKTCFQGLYRENKQGKFNVPQGRQFKFSIEDKIQLYMASEKLRIATLLGGSFDHTLQNAVHKDAFVYLDPPYDDTYSSYSKHGFDKAQHALLRYYFGICDRRGAKVMLSTSDTLYMRCLYNGYRVDKLDGRQTMAAKSSGKRPVQELVVRNY